MLGKNLKLRENHCLIFLPIHNLKFKKFKVWQPISLCDDFYKIVAKSLVERIKNNLPHLIHHAQHDLLKAAGTSEPTSS
jgi:hypothetical protein